MDLSVFASEWTLIFLFAGLAENWPGLIVSGLFLAVCRNRNIAWGEATAYTCYFLAGAVVAHLQLRIALGIPLGEYGLSGHGAEVVVALLFVIALAAAYRRLHKSPALIMLAVLTLTLGVLQFSEIRTLILNYCARVYAFACIIVPIGALLRTFWRADHSLR